MEDEGDRVWSERTGDKEAGGDEMPVVVEVSDAEESTDHEQARELPPDDASSRNSAGWGEGLEDEDAPSEKMLDANEEADDDEKAPTEEMLDADEEAAAVETSDHVDARFGQLHDIGFAFAKSASLLREFQTGLHSRTCIDGA